MAVLINDCPHCHASTVGLQIFGHSVFPIETGYGKQVSAHAATTMFWDISAIAKCPACFKPVALLLRHEKPTSSYNDLLNLAKRLESESIGIETIGFYLRSLWPEPKRPEIPKHIPTSVERALLQAEHNYPIHGNEEAAASMYRRTLEICLKEKYPAMTGTLATRIKELVRDATLTSAIGDWSDEIRSLGNEAVHDLSEVDRDQLTTIRGFTDAVLQYLFTLPAEVKARRKIP